MLAPVAICVRASKITGVNMPLPYIYIALLETLFRQTGAQYAEHRTGSFPPPAGQGRRFQLSRGTGLWLPFPVGV